MRYLTPAPRPVPKPYSVKKREFIERFVIERAGVVKDVKVKEEVRSAEFCWDLIQIIFEEDFSNESSP